MPTIRIRNAKKEIEFYDKSMSVYQAISNLNWVMEHRCINCDSKCTDCYFDYMDKISVETLIKYFRRNKKKIRKAVGINEILRRRKVHGR